MDFRNMPIKIDDRREVSPIQGAYLMMLLDQFIQAQDVSEGSKTTYSRQLRQFIAWLMETGRVNALNGLQRQDILTYRKNLQEIGKSSYTVDGYLTSVRKFFEWLEEEKIYPNIATGIKGTKKAKGFRKDCLTPHQIREALASIDRGTPEGLRDYALFNLLVRTGLRAVEVARSQVGDLRQESGEAVLWVQGKGRDTKDNFVLLVDETLKPLREYLSARGNLADTDPLFASNSDRSRGQALTTRSVRRIIKKILKGINLIDKRLSAHSLRHSAVTLAIKGGASLEQAQAMARHADPKTTMIYFHNMARLENGAERFVHF